MTQRVVAIFESREAGAVAESQLRADGYSTGLEQVLGPPRQVQRDEVAGVETDVGPLSTHPDAEAWMVVVRAPFGHARRIINTLNGFGAVEIREGRSTSSMERRESQRSFDGPPPEDTLSDHAFFVSSIVGLPLLVNCPAPLSHLLGLPTLIRD